VLEIRRFFCDSATCPRQIFAERVPFLATVHARRTAQMDQALAGIAFTCGGEGGARLAVRLGMCTSPDTMLRRIRRTTLNDQGTPRVLGVDDWAMRKGQRYGTILCDLEHRRPLELLSERSAETLSAWLMAHPGVELISRDRGGSYAQGAASGAPAALQIADRFHLLKNVRDALVRLLDRHHEYVKTAARMALHAIPRAPPPVHSPATPVLAKPPTPQNPLPSPRSRRMQRYEQVRELHRQGVSQRQIARLLGLDRGTVARFACAETYPERAARPYPTRVDAFAEYLRERWAQGCRNAAQLTRELRSEGFAGSYFAIKRFLTRHFHESPRDTPPMIPLPPRTPSSRCVASWLLRAPEQLTSEQRAFVRMLGGARQELQRARRLVRRFGRLVRERLPDELERWLARASRPSVPPELRRFAKGLRADRAAVRAALMYPWSNGQVEGQINRLKLIKRQMYGRAKLDLLRKRVLYRG
jgi:transposase